LSISFNHKNTHGGKDKINSDSKATANERNESSPLASKRNEHFFSLHSLRLCGSKQNLTAEAQRKQRVFFS
jgi:hypothetical protein